MNNLINRSVLTLIKDWLNKNKVIIIYGARQVGKTTISKQLIAEQGEDKCKYFNCEVVANRKVFESDNLLEIVNNFDGKKFIVVDEAQKVKNIGSILKQLHDEYPDIQIIATGSSSFELGNKLNEPLTGRNIKYTVYPLSVKEISQVYGYTQIGEKLESLLRFGSYPGVFDNTDQQCKDLLDVMANDYLYRDVLVLENIKKPALLEKLLSALAFQIGNEVNYNELAKLLGTTPPTVERYVDLLEKSFVIYRLRSFSRNSRNELKKGFKVYFYDLGIRNSLIQAYNPIEFRNDIGALFENFCVMERVKQIQSKKEGGNLYFWRSYLPDKEIDFIEERNGKLFAFEFKWNPKASGNARLPKNFFESYGSGENEGNVEFRVIDNENWRQWLLN